MPFGYQHFVIALVFPLLSLMEVCLVAVFVQLSAKRVLLNNFFYCLQFICSLLLA